jgi:LAO/AO transport system kinase
MISLGMPPGPRNPEDPVRWRPPVVTTVASTGQGVDELVAALDEHERWAAASGELRLRRLRRAEREIEAIALTALRERIGGLRGGDRLSTLAEQVVEGRDDPWTAADALVADLSADGPGDDSSATRPLSVHRP